MHKGLFEVVCLAAALVAPATSLGQTAPLTTEPLPSATARGGQRCGRLVAGPTR
jgi:hypothetical protein